MSIKKEIDRDQKLVRVRIDGHFDFSQHKAFRDAYRDVSPQEGWVFEIDLSHTTYLDSAALGMLLLLREHTGEAPGRIRVVNVQPDVHRVLEIANFHRLFDIDGAGSDGSRTDGRR